ncbi:MAG: c-type cytochrome [Burkholderiales bacterium]
MTRIISHVLAVILAVVALVTPVRADNFFGGDQAARGERLYETHCSTCHGSMLEGKSSVPLAGESFRARWSDEGHTLDDLLYIVRTQMPYGEPGKLTKAQYLDIVAFLLKANAYPGGGEDLPLDPEELASKKLKR